MQYQNNIEFTEKEVIADFLIDNIGVVQEPKYEFIGNRDFYTVEEWDRYKIVLMIATNDEGGKSIELVVMDGEHPIGTTLAMNNDKPITIPLLNADSSDMNKWQVITAVRPIGQGYIAQTVALNTFVVEAIKEFKSIVFNSRISLN